jgi:hypothetical protein
MSKRGLDTAERAKLVEIGDTEVPIGLAAPGEGACVCSVVETHDSQQELDGRELALAGGSQAGDQGVPNTRGEHRGKGNLLHGGVGEEGRGRAASPC